MTLATVALVAAAIAVGFIAGIVRRGSVRRLQPPGIRALPAVFMAVAIDLVVRFVSPPATAVYLLVSIGLLVGFCLCNLHLVGMSIVAVGLLMNLAGVAVNRAYAVDREAAADAARRGDLGGGRVLDDHSLDAWFLGQVVPLRPVREVVSFGDLVSAAGLLDAAYRATRKRRRAVVELTSSARTGLTSLAAPSRRFDDQPVIDLRLANRATYFGYAERTRDAATPDRPSRAPDPSTTAGSHRGPAPSRDSSTRPTPSATRTRR